MGNQARLVTFSRHRKLDPYQVEREFENLNKHLPAVSVQAHGARGQSGVNDFRAFQLAQTEASRVGGFVWVPPTEDGYTIGDGSSNGSGIQLLDGVQWLGFNTKIVHKAKNSEGTRSLFTADGVSDWSVVGFYVVGDGANIQRVVDMDGLVDDFVIDRLVVEDVGGGVVHYGETDVSISQIRRGTITRIRRYGFVNSSTQPIIQLFPRLQSDTITFDANSGVDLTTEQITLTSHGLALGQRVRYSAGDGTAIGGLTGQTVDYFVIVVDSNTIKLATSRANAYAGTAVNLTTKPSSENHYINPEGGVSTSIGMFLDELDIDGSNNDGAVATHAPQCIKLNNLKDFSVGRVRLRGGSEANLSILNGCHNGVVAEAQCSFADLGLSVSTANQTACGITQNIHIESVTFRLDGLTTSNGDGVFVSGSPERVSFGRVHSVDGDVGFDIGGTDDILHGPRFGKVVIENGNFADTQPGSTSPPCQGLTVEELYLRGGPASGKGLVSLGGSNRQFQQAHLGHVFCDMPDGNAVLLSNCTDVSIGRLEVLDGNPDDTASRTALNDLSVRTACGEIVVRGRTASFDPSTDVDLGDDAILNTGHGLTTGQALTYDNGGGTDIGGLTTGTVYFAIANNPGALQLATTQANALAGTAIDLTTVPGSETHTLDPNQMDWFYSESTAGRGDGTLGQVRGSVVDTTSEIRVLNRESAKARQGTRTVTTENIDLSGSAITDKPIFAADQDCIVLGVTYTYTEASSADAGINVTLKRNRAGSSSTLFVYVSEVSKAVGFQQHYNNTSGTRSFTVRRMQAGDFLTLSSAGGKTGTGELVGTISLVRMVTT